MTTLRRIFSILAVLTLAACGGGGGSAGTPTFGGGSTPGGGSTGPTVSDLTVVLSAPTIPNTGVGAVTATITALDGNRNALPGATVTVSANSGAILTVQGALGSVTDADGQIVASVGIGADSTNRDITVSATSGSITRSAILKVVTSASNNAASVEVLSSASSVTTGGGEVTITAVVKDERNVALANTVVSFASDTGTLLGASASTNASGVATARFTAGANRTNRVATVTVAAGTVSGNVTLEITGSQVQVSGPQTLSVGESSQIRVLAQDGNNLPLAGIAIPITSSLGNGLSNPSPTTDVQGIALVTYTGTRAGSDVLTVAAAGTTSTLAVQVANQDNLIFVAPLLGDRTIPLNAAPPTPITVEYRVNGTPTSGSTLRVRFAATSGIMSPASAATGIPLGANGRATANITSSFAGPATIQATLIDSSNGSTIAQAQLPLQFVAREPTNLLLQITPKSTGPNLAGSTANQVEVRATVTDGSNPVQGSVVNFSKVADPSGGNLSEASAVSDINGQATVRFVAGATATASDAIRIRATVADNVAVFDEETLTVNQSALFIALGTGNTISNLNETTYEKVWTVYVTDSSGAAVPNQLVTVSVLPTRYRKGSYVLVDDVYVSGAWNGAVDSEGDMAAGNYFTCGNEDANYDGIWTTLKDKNGNLRLDPGNVITVNGGTNVTTVTTDASGFALLRLRYAESYAHWVEVDLRASATVGGTESTNVARFFAVGLKSDYTVGGGPPAGLISPFGQRPSCTDPL
ncbi:MAG: Ig-like domain-containing protein [Rubrivivax sp.]|nr:Ig-like domain-containing protein [Rubrivivax sp.]